MSNTEVVQRIERSDRETVMEAARFLAKSLAKGESRVDEARALFADWGADPFVHVEEVELLARAVLTGAAQRDDLVSEVKNALDGADRKQFVLGGTEIVALAAIGTVALGLLLRKGQGETTETTTATFNGKGGVTISVTKVNKPFSIGKELGALLAEFFKRGNG